jgi:hypothetical protein
VHPEMGEKRLLLGINGLQSYDESLAS